MKRERTPAHLDLRVKLYMLPSDLRRIADQMEAWAAGAPLPGASTLATVWAGDGVNVEFHFDQEAGRDLIEAAWAQERLRQEGSA